MAYNHNISVKVCGNPESSGGFGPILLLNNPSFVVEDQFYVGFDKNSFFFTITTYQTQTVYKLVKNNVRSSGAFRVGSLVIAISIPKNYKLEGGYTPYDVLCALKDEFLKKCMTCKDPVRETYEYNAGKIDGHVLDEVVGKFTLTCFRTPDRVMTPNGPVGYIEETEEKIKEFFQDINYPEFDKFKEVVVATTVHTTSYVPISNIQIPRPKKYEVIVDGERKGFYSNLNEKIPVECHRKSSDYYDNLSWEFSIQDLIDNYVSHEGVDCDTGQERVIVNTQSWGTPKKEKVSLAIFPEEDEDYFVRYPQELKVTLFSSNSKTSKKVDVSQQGLVITLEGNEIAALKDGGIKVATDQQSEYVVAEQELNERGLQVKVTQRNWFSLSPAGNLTVNVTFPEDKDLEGIRYVDLQAKNCINNQDVFSVSNLLLKRSSEKEGYNGKFKIRAKNVPPCDFYLKCSIKNEVWKTGEIKPNQKSVTVTFFKIHRPFTDRYKKPLVCVLVTMMALVLGGLSFVLYNRLSKEGDKQVAQKQEFTPKVKAEPSLSDVESLLQTRDLTFFTVDSLYDLYLSQQDATAKPANKAAFQRLYDYQKVIGFIREGKVDAIKRVVESKYKYKLYDIHQKVLELIVKDDNKEKFQSNYQDLKGFDDIRKQYSNNTAEKQPPVDPNPAHNEEERSNPANVEAKGISSRAKRKAGGKSNTPPNSQLQCTQGCKRGGSPLRFNTQGELDAHDMEYHER